jgi:hypothetical protein
LGMIYCFPSLQRIITDQKSSLIFIKQYNIVNSIINVAFFPREWS